VRSGDDACALRWTLPARPYGQVTQQKANYLLTYGDGTHSEKSRLQSDELESTNEDWTVRRHCWIWCWIKNGAEFGGVLVTKTIVAVRKRRVPIDKRATGRNLDQQPFRICCFESGVARTEFRKEVSKYGRWYFALWVTGWVAVHCFVEWYGEVVWEGTCAEFHVSSFYKGTEEFFNVHAWMSKSFSLPQPVVGVGSILKFGIFAA
jgi:hypothetical protein